MAGLREIALAASSGFDACFRELIAHRRAEPHDDILSALAQVEEEGDVLTEREMLNMLRLLIVIGNETATNLIGNGERSTRASIGRTTEPEFPPGEQAREQVPRALPTAQVPKRALTHRGTDVERGELAGDVRVDSVAACILESGLQGAVVLEGVLVTDVEETVHLRFPLAENASRVPCGLEGRNGRARRNAGEASGGVPSVTASRQGRSH